MNECALAGVDAVELNGAAATLITSAAQAAARRRADEWSMVNSRLQRLR